MDVLLDTLWQNPELALFLLGGRDYVVDGLKRQSQPIGAVLGVLLVGLVVGQLGISIGDEVKWILFYFFLFAIAFKCVPQFLQSPRDSGFALLVSNLSVAILPNLVTLLIGQFVFKVHPGIPRGICAEAGTSAPALAAT